MDKAILWKIIFLVFIISWAGILPSLLIAHNIPIPESLKGLNVLMTLGTLIGALIFVYKTNGKHGIKDLFSRLFYFKTSLIVMGIAIGFPLLNSFLSANIGFHLSETTWPETYTPQSILLNALSISAMYLLLNTEEFFWRGVVFDELLKKYSFLKSCLILGPIWWLFHLPLFLFPGGHLAGYGMEIFIPLVFAQTIILGWIYTKSNRSLFYVHMSHQLSNGLGEAFPIFPVFIQGNIMPSRIFTFLFVMLAIFLVWKHLKAKEGSII